MKHFGVLRKWCKKIEIEIFDKLLIFLDHVTYKSDFKCCILSIESRNNSRDVIIRVMDVLPNTLVHFCMSASHITSQVISKSTPYLHSNLLNSSIYIFVSDCHTVIDLSTNSMYLPRFTQNDLSCHVSVTKPRELNAWSYCQHYIIVLTITPSIRGYGG